jgi:ferritin
MISQKMENALNEQVNKEMYSAYLYMSMSSYSDSVGLKGFANWFMVQYHEDLRIHTETRGKGGGRSDSKTPFRV